MFKNVGESTFEEIILDKGFYLLHFQNESKTIQNFEREINSTFIQIHFCLRGKSKFLFNHGSYSFDVLDDRSILLYNPQRILPINLEIQPKTTLVSLLISIEKFHSLFSKESGYIPFLSDENSNKKYYDDSEIKPTVSIVLQQIINSSVNSSIKDLYVKGKVYELLSLHFQQEENTEGEYCPFLVDEQNVLKIRKAKEIIISRMAEPPSLQELANEIGLNIKKLKEGFKQIYGDTVFSFLFDYKMEHARRLLESNQFNVNEVGVKIGYSTSSHFIAAFKKKFGTTPKKYVMSFNQ
ncbi:AraC-type DNA-binding protein [Polaribacter sp. Hel1_33_78]|jgi:AraC family transcriptional activator of pyochelin receptor|uniref:AraC family transcriptional regulator n=1 Tax=unclassified Polaribacter TaxID=196858 RepID=UPI00052E2DDE|nr:MULTISPECIES: AraC family transcriptional regulator [unclassified Polaribacter]KGL61593.1 transcriptional regulator, AraC family [Polaribacter sp. Hel1_33_49]MBT3742672.1 AraC family transcriptional regulator [Polaribacter sp.]MBT4412980.1 AraC family transcriptional regulator [Polaribacter sp.]MBT7817085.1 AraC family transcriptional regulator [Polaribacter sp.]MDG1195246.1 AraC family transcriptional regulator [Polaribacter sp.]